MEGDNLHEMSNPASWYAEKQTRIQKSCLSCKKPLGLHHVCQVLLINVRNVSVSLLNVKNSIDKFPRGNFIVRK